MTAQEQPLRLLLVDDNEADRLAVRRALDLVPLRAEVVEAVDLRSAVDSLRVTRVDCVVLDSSLTMSGGLDFIAAARAADVELESPLIVLTDPADESKVADLMEGGAGDYLPKKLLSPEHLAHSIRRVLRVRDAEKRAQQARDDLERQASRLEGLAEASVRIHSTLSVEETLELFVREARELVGARTAIVRFAGSAEGAPPMVRRSGAADISAAEFQSLGAVADRALIEKKLSGVVREDDDELQRLDSPSAKGGLLAAKLGVRGRRPKGSIFLLQPDYGSFTPSDEALLGQLAQTTYVALENAMLYRTAQNATRARDDIIAIVSHDLRSPLNVVSLSAALLGRHLERPSDLSLVRRIEQGARRMNRLIEDLLDATRIDSGTFAISARAEKAVLLARDAVESAATLVEASQCELTLGAMDEGLVVRADRYRVAQLFSNLLGNAFKFTSRGGTIQLTLERQGTYAHFAVHDTGRGVAPDQLEHLFERYWKGVENSQEGAGLGLFIAKGIVGAHGGTIGIESALGKGTVVHFTLPLAI